MLRTFSTTSSIQESITIPKPKVNKRIPIVKPTPDYPNHFSAHHAGHVRKEMSRSLSKCFSFVSSTAVRWMVMFELEFYEPRSETHSNACAFLGWQFVWLSNAERCGGNLGRLWEWVNLFWTLLQPIIDTGNCSVCCFVCHVNKSLKRSREEMSVENLFIACSDRWSRRKMPQNILEHAADHWSNPIWSNPLASILHLSSLTHRIHRWELESSATTGTTTIVFCIQIQNKETIWERKKNLLTVFS